MLRFGILCLIPLSFVGGCERLKESASAFSALKKTATGSSETPVTTYKTTWCNNARTTVLISMAVKSSNLIWCACVYSYFCVGSHA